MMNTDYWASLDQYTSFAKEPWGFNRPENRKDDNLLSRATFAEWPNTTCDFSIQRGLAPPGKLSVSKAREAGRSRHETASPSSSTSTKKKTRTLCTTNNECTRTKKTNGRSTDAIGTSAAAVATFGGTRNSADNVTSAYPLTSTRFLSSRHTVRTPSPKKTEKNQQREFGGWNAASSPWSVNNIGFNNLEGASRVRRKREDDEGYVNAAFASQKADRPYIAEALHFRARYPHTLGHIAALSHARGDRRRATIKGNLEG